MESSIEKNEDYIRGCSAALERLKKLVKIENLVGCLAVASIELGLVVSSFIHLYINVLGVADVNAIGNSKSIVTTALFTAGLAVMALLSVRGNVDGLRSEDKRLVESDREYREYYKIYTRTNGFLAGALVFGGCAVTEWALATISKLEAGASTVMTPGIVFITIMGTLTAGSLAMAIWSAIELNRTRKQLKEYIDGIVPTDKDGEVAGLTEVREQLKEELSGRVPAEEDSGSEERCLFKSDVRQIGEDKGAREAWT